MEGKYLGIGRVSPAGAQTPSVLVEEARFEVPEILRRTMMTRFFSFFSPTYTVFFPFTLTFVFPFRAACGTGPPDRDHRRVAGGHKKANFMMESALQTPFLAETTKVPSSFRKVARRMS